MSSIRFSIDLEYERFLRFYQGEAQMVQVVADDGRQIRFPAAALRPHLQHSGIQGRFEIVFDANHKLKALNRLA